MSVAEGTRVTCGLTTGRRPFNTEQESLVGSGIEHPYNPLTKITHTAFQPCYEDSGTTEKAFCIVPDAGGCSAIDVLVSTPGRLLDHLEYTCGFTLQHVRFLVLDEADHLLSNAYHSWVRDLVRSIDKVTNVSAGAIAKSLFPFSYFKVLEADEETRNTVLSELLSQKASHILATLLVQCYPL